MGFGSRPFCGKEAYQPASVARHLQEQWQGRIRRRVRWRSRHLEGGARLGLQDSPWRPHRACHCSPCRQGSSGKQANKLHPACSCQVPTYQSSIPICLSAMPIHWSFMPIRQSSLPMLSVIPANLSIIHAVWSVICALAMTFVGATQGWIGV